jgi:O-antigen/teichoic acid export membrane protein
MLIVMAVNLFTVRIVLGALGFEDYGIYDVVAGIVTMLSGLSNVLGSATQRFYSKFIGEQKNDQLQAIFSDSFKLHLHLIIIVFLISESIGLWFLNTQLNIPEERIFASNLIFQFSILSFVFSFIHIPYSAALVAHEDLGTFAFISLIESFLKFFAGLVISTVYADRLILYGAFLLAISFLVSSGYILMARKKYKECVSFKFRGKKLNRELLSFSGWSLFGSAAGISISHVLTILINVFFGPITNASRAISIQFNLALSSFSSSFLLAVRTPMIKAYAETSYAALNTLFYFANKVLLYCLLVITVPLFFEMDLVLKVWLDKIDAQTILFSRLMLIYTIVMLLNNPISIIIQAIGRVKEYHLLVETFTLICVPITYFFFKMGYQAYVSYIILIISAAIAHIARLISLKKYYHYFSYSTYLKNFLLPGIMVTLCASLFVFLVTYIDLHGIFKLFISIITSFLSILFCVLMFGFSDDEQAQLGSFFRQLKISQYFKFKF